MPSDGQEQTRVQAMAMNGFVAPYEKFFSVSRDCASGGPRGPSKSACRLTAAYVALGRRAGAGKVYTKPPQPCPSGTGPSSKAIVWRSPVTSYFGTKRT